MWGSEDVARAVLGAAEAVLDHAAAELLEEPLTALVVVLGHVTTLVEDLGRPLTASERSILRCIVAEVGRLVTSVEPE